MTNTEQVEQEVTTQSINPITPVNSINPITSSTSPLSLGEQVLKEQQIDLSSAFVKKRNGTKERFSIKKLEKVCEFATQNNPYYTKMIFSNFVNKLHDDMTTSEISDLLIRTSANLISKIYSDFEYITARFLLLKIYKETWIQKVHNNKLNYPDLSNVIKKGVKSGAYGDSTFSKYSDDEIDTLNHYIVQERDYLFTYKALYFFYSKYCFRTNNKETFELPQNAYMRVAMSLMADEPKKERLGLVKRFYNALSLHEVTFATPIMLNAGSKRQQLSSCVLSVVDDSAESIMDSAKNLAIYSKYKGGTALDVSYLRASGSYIQGNNGFSSGPVPFIKIIESVMTSFNQGSTRPGACAIYYNWWHWNIKELAVLKNNNGTEQNRARFLKYGVKLNQLFIDRVLKDESISLFDPKDVPMLLCTYGQEFDKWYSRYESNSDIRKQTMPARDLMGLLLKERVETGNIYLFHIENVNEQSLLNRYINSSNLCTEITLPTKFSIPDEEKLNIKQDKITKEYVSGEIALCNLASINLVAWDAKNDDEKFELAYITTRALDNTVDIADYPVLEAKYSNMQYRFLGIGVLNYANYLALNKANMQDQLSLELTAKTFDHLTYDIIKSSMLLAKLKGKFSKFNDTEWSKGILPIDKANEKALALTDYQPDKKKWNALRDEIKKHGIRNGTLLALAPTATSGKAINATESTEPIQMEFYKEDGTISVPTLAPNLKKNYDYYKIAVECDQYKLMELAAIRQCYIDQAQSINVYFRKVDSATDFMMLHLYAFALGIKTFYYCKTVKDVEICESCS